MEKNHLSRTNCTSYQLDLFASSNILSDTTANTNKVNENECSGMVIQLNSFKTKQQIDLYYEAAKRMTAHLDTR